MAFFTPESLKALLQALQQADIDLVVVGGQAINLWAIQYCQASADWDVLQPFTSVDLDFYGSRIEAVQCGETLQSHSAQSTGHKSSIDWLNGDRSINN